MTVSYLEKQSSDSLTENKPIPEGRSPVRNVHPARCLVRCGWRSRPSSRPAHRGQMFSQPSLQSHRQCVFQKKKKKKPLRPDAATWCPTRPPLTYNWACSSGHHMTSNQILRLRAISHADDGAERSRNRVASWGRRDRLAAARLTGRIYCHVVLNNES